MYKSTRSKKPGSEAGIETNTRKKKVRKSEEVAEKSISRTESWVEVELGKEDYTPEVALERRQEEDVAPSESSGEEDAETEEFEKENPIEVEEAEEVEVEPPAMINPLDGGAGGPPPPPPGAPIPQFIRPRGLPILVPQNLVPIEMPPDLPKFYGTRDDDPSRHTERYIERMTMTLITIKSKFEKEHLHYKTMREAPKCSPSINQLTPTCHGFHARNRGPCGSHDNPPHGEVKNSKKMTRHTTRGHLTTCPKQIKMES